MDRGKLRYLLLLLPIIVAITFLLYQVSPTQSDTLVIIPNLTANAYAKNGFYFYFEGVCDESCLTVPLDKDIHHGYTSSSNGLILLQKKGYEMIQDTVLILDPDYIDDYDNIILLHNEYVTKELFDKITSHPYVFYLYPNALYGEVVVEFEGVPTMTLIRGHGVEGADNAFDWEHENTRPDEFDAECLEYEWKQVSNGWQLNCYPENAMLHDDSILQFIEDNLV